MSASSSAAGFPLTYASDQDRRFDWANYLALTLGCLIFAGLSAWLAYSSESDLEADATTHFLIARFALREYHYLTSVWGRPLCTIAYAFAARIGTVEQGRFAARLTSLGLALVVAMVTYLIAKRQGFRRPALVAILLLGQPVFFLHSFSQLTEIPFAVVLMLAFLAYQRRQWLAMAALVGLLPLGRPEGFGFILMAAVALIAHRRAQWLWVLVVPLVAWDYAGFAINNWDTLKGAKWWWWIFNSEWPGWIKQQWPYSYESVYGKGYLLSFVARLPALVGPLIFPFTVVGLGLELRGLLPEHRGGEGWFSWLRGMTHERRCEIWIVLIPLSILAVHSLLWWRGKMGSNGELRYLLIVSPFFAMAGARGWEWIWSRFRWKAPMFWAAVAAVVPASVNSFYRVLPFPLYADGAVARDVVQWYRSQSWVRREFPTIMPTLPGIYYFLDLSQTDTSRTIAAAKSSVQNAPPGALLLWDPIYGANNANQGMCVSEQEILEAGWIPFKRFEMDDVYCQAYLSPRTRGGEDTREVLREYVDRVFQLPRGQAPATTRATR
jgi:hypothetical protein